MRKNLRKSRRIIAMLTVLIFVFSFAIPVAAQDADYSDAIERVGSVGAMVGDDQGFRPGDTLTRAEFATIAARVSGYEADQTAATETPFSDVDPSEWWSDAIAYAAANGIINGYPDGTFGPRNQVTYREMATMLIRVLGHDDGTLSWPVGYDLKANELGLVGAAYTANPNAQAIRGEVAVATATTIFDTVAADGKTLAETVYGQTPPAEEVDLAVESVNAVGVKKLEITFSTAVDPDEAVITVRRGAVTINIDNIEFADDNKSAVIETLSNLTQGEYTVTVTGVSDEGLTGTTSVQNETVSEINFLSDTLLLNRDDAKKAATTVRVLNQYGENMTSRASGLTITPSKGALNPTMSNQGVIELDNTGLAGGATDTDFEKDNTVFISILHAASGTFASATLTVIDYARVATVEITELYHEDDEVLDVNSTSSEFALVIQAKDQYGNNWGTSAPARGHLEEDVVISVSNTNVANVAANITTIGSGSNTKNVLRLQGGLSAGTTVVSIVSKITGHLTSFAVEVQEASKVDQLTITAPALIVAGEETELEFVAIDQFGNAITKAADLTIGPNQAINSLTTSAGTISFEHNFVTDTTKLIFDATGITSETTVQITGVTGTNKVVQLTINVEDPAEPTVITGISSSAVTNFVEGGTASLAAGNLTILDQYGRTMSGSALGLGALATDYQISVSTTSSGADRVSINGGSTADITATGSGGAVTLAGESETGNATITVKLRTNNADVANSEYSFTARSVAKADIATYVIEDIDTLYSGDSNGASDPNDYSRDLEVSGQLASGAKVAIPSAGSPDIFYTVNAVTNGLVYDNVTGEVYAQYVVGMFSGSSQSATGTLVVTIDADGGPQVVTKSVPISQAEPEPTTLSIRSSIAGDPNRESSSLVSVSAGYFAGSTASDLVNAAVQIRDQYGVTLTTSANISGVYATSLPSGKTLATLASGETCSITAIANNGKVITFTVVIR